LPFAPNICWIARLISQVVQLVSDFNQARVNGITAFTTYFWSANTPPTHPPCPWVIVSWLVFANETLSATFKSVRDSGDSSPCCGADSLASSFTTLCSLSSPVQTARITACP
jgi:hypothetical protein